MENKNSKSESYIVREAENIIENYLREREMCDINKLYKLMEKYERLKILFVVFFIVSCIGILISIIF